VCTQHTRLERTRTDSHETYELTHDRVLTCRHCHPKIIGALVDQAHKMTLTSRAFHNDALGPFEKSVLPRVHSTSGACLPVRVRVVCACLGEKHHRRCVRAFSIAST
jgi:hypothetical protein